jgi:hypothetical protein
MVQDTNDRERDGGSGGTAMVNHVKKNKGKYGMLVLFIVAIVVLNLL